MTKPQQPELHRSNKGATDQDSAQLNADEQLPSGEGGGRIPEANRPGHRPAQDQDKPSGPPRR